MERRRSSRGKSAVNPVIKKIKQIAKAFYRVFAFLVFVFLLLYVIYNFWCLLVDKQAYPFTK